MCGVLIVLAASRGAAAGDGMTPGERVWLEQVTRSLERQGFEVRSSQRDDDGRAFQLRFRGSSALRSGIRNDQPDQLRK